MLNAEGIRAMSPVELRSFMANIDARGREELMALARGVCDEQYGDGVFLRGLIEISNYCRMSCLYCGINREIRSVQRYRLTPNEIIECVAKGYELGFRSFVLQGGEDPWFTDEILSDLIGSIKSQFQGVAITLSLGERGRESFERLFKAGADRYLLRHESSSKRIYDTLHPGMSFENRVESLKCLKEIGFQTGAGFLVGLPGQGVDEYLDELLFLRDLEPEMVGMGPFIPQSSTVMANHPAGSLEDTLLLISLIRIILPQALIPATTAVSTLNPNGRKMALDAGANVIMPNLSPFANRCKYSLYDGKRFVSEESAEELDAIKKDIASYGYVAKMERGDHKSWIVRE
ncbi:MAG: [FeFe] hydrogenase H-cluster radical SAM maturase HydE [Bacteroidales bacterium]